MGTGAVAPVQLYGSRMNPTYSIIGAIKARCDWNGKNTTVKTTEHRTTVSLLNFPIAIIEWEKCSVAVCLGNWNSLATRHCINAVFHALQMSHEISERNGCVLISDSRGSEVEIKGYETLTFYFDRS
jgi:hypothetical protein